MELKTLANIIQSSVEQIEQVVTANSFNFPSPESPYSLESEAPRMHPGIQSAGLLITSAAAQLMTLVRPSRLALQDVMNQVRFKVWAIYYFPQRRKTKFHVSTAIRTAVSTHVAEILRNAGPMVILVIFHHPSAGINVLLCRENT